MVDRREEESKYEELRNAWLQATDEDVLAAAFRADAPCSYAALAVVYDEFVRRGLPVPEEPTVLPHGRSHARFPKYAVSSAMLIYMGGFSLWCAILFGVFGVEFTITKAPGVASTLLLLFVYLLVVLPPGTIAILFLRSRYGGYRPDPEGYTRCGRCAHILRGLSEPRCPECGERL